MKMTDKEYKELMEWLKQKDYLFPPVGRTPNKHERDDMFFWANKLDPAGNHRPTSCGRCYYNARKAIMRALNIF